MKSKIRIRCFRSKGVMVILVWYALVSGSLTLPAFLSPASSNWKPEPIHHWIAMTAMAACYTFYFIVGLMSDVWCGRYKVILLSVEIVWCGVLFLTLGATVAPQHSFFFIEVVAIAIVYAGKAGIEVNVVQYGCDQLLPEASSNELSSFISWCAWSSYVGFGLGFILSYVLQTVIDNYSVVVVGGFFSCIFCLLLTVHFCWTHKWLLKDSQTINAYSTVYMVLAYAWKHRYPERRSALTFWEEGLPSRIDLGKSKYGGPFTVEQVEDVKTFIRILCVSAAIAITVVGYGATFIGDFVLFFHLGIYQNASATMSGQYYSICVILLIPIYEILVLPFLKQYAPTSIFSLWITVLLSLVSVAFNLLIDSVGHRLSPHDVTCLFNYSSEANNTLAALSPWMILLPVIPGSLAYAIGYVSVLKFLVAQSPQQMKGMLIGIFYSLWGLGTLFGCLLAFPFFFAYPQLTSSSSLSCGTIYYLVCTVICAFGTFCSTVAIKNYKRREREEVLGNEQQFAISYYEWYIE